jgi:hypothetical protein
MATAETITRHLRRHRFAVLGYSAEDDVYCPECLRGAAGLSPSREDSRGKPIIPLYLADPTVREEVCCHCERQLIDILPSVEPPTVYEIARLAHDPDSTIIRKRSIGTLILDVSGHGSLFVKELQERFYIFPDDRPAEKPVIQVHARPPTIRRGQLR